MVSGEGSGEWGDERGSGQVVIRCVLGLHLQASG